MKSTRTLVYLVAITLAIGCRSTSTNTTPAAPTDAKSKSASTSTKSRVTEKTRVAEKARVAEQPLTDEQRAKNIASFDKVWETIRDRHFDPTYNGVDWNAVRTELRPKVESAKTMAEARGVMSEMLARLGQTHFAILPGSLYAKIDEAKKPSKTTDPDATSKGDDDNAKGDGVAGLELRLVDNHVLVTKVELDGAAAAAGVRPGWELVAIRDKPIAPIIEGFNEAMKPSPLRDATAARTLEGALHGRVGRSVPVTFTDNNDAKITKSIKLMEPKGNVSKALNLPEIHVVSECKRVRPNIAYYYLSIFLDPPRVMPMLRTCVEEAAATGPNHADGFVLDLRGNPGGIGFMAVGMANLFTNEPGKQLGVMSARGKPEMLKFVLNQQPVTFDGPLAVLIDECSMSTSEILAGGLKDLKRARVFGVRSAGAALPSVIEELPNGDRFQFAVANYTSAGGQVLEGHGVEPDEKVVPDRKALLAGKDPILDAAVQWIETETKNGKK